MDYQEEFMILRAEHRELLRELKRMLAKLSRYKTDPMRNNSLIIELEGEIQVTRDTIKNKSQRIKEIKRIVKSLTKNMTNLELQVFYGKYIRGESLNAISKRLNFSHSHIKRISAQLGAKLSQAEEKR